MKWHTVLTPLQPPLLCVHPQSRGGAKSTTRHGGGVGRTSISRQSLGLLVDLRRVSTRLATACHRGGLDGPPHHW